MTVVHSVTESEAGAVSTTVFGGTLAIADNAKDGSNRLLLTLVDGRVELMLNGFRVAGVNLNDTGTHNLVVRAFVRGEPAANEARVVLGSATLWQPAEQGAAAE